MRVGRGGANRPLSSDWGFDRGTAIDRFYIEKFLDSHRHDIKGDVLEIAEDTYSARFGGDKILRQHVLDLDPGNARATFVGDLADPATLPAASFDCILITQTLHLIFDMPAAIRHVRTALRPGGVVLITVPGITPIDRGSWRDSWYWSLTEPALRRLLSASFEADSTKVESFGNLHSATAFLHGAAVQDTAEWKLLQRDPSYPVTIAARAVA